VGAALRVRQVGLEQLTIEPVRGASRALFECLNAIGV